MDIINKLLGNSLIFSLWSAPLNRQKMYFLHQIMPDIHNVKVLDVGCGPASNTFLFDSCDYTGIDINPDYIAYARKLYPKKKFFVKDVTALDMGKDKFDIIYINALFHHLTDEDIHTMLSQLNNILESDGNILIIEPLTPPSHKFLQTVLMKLDRGKYYRSDEEYHKLVEPMFSIRNEGVFPLKCFALTGWLQLAMCVEKKN